MCDYSMHSVARRPAKVADKLISTLFTNGWNTVGLADVGQPNVAVCLRPGTQLAIDDPLKANRRWLGALLEPLIGPRVFKGGTAKFIKINEGYVDRHHDALEMPNGKIVMLTHLHTGQKLRVLQLPVEQSKRPAAQVDAVAETSAA